MIGRTEAERLSLAVHDIRPDWPMPQLMTLIAELKDWPLRDLAVGLVWVATDQTIQGDWASKTPYRVREQGPWRTVGISNAELETQRQRAERDLAMRKEAIAARTQAVDDCPTCDDDGRLASGRLCTHDQRATQTESRGAALARQALADARAARQTPTVTTEENR